MKFCVSFRVFNSFHLDPLVEELYVGGCNAKLEHLLNLMIVKCLRTQSFFTNKKIISVVNLN